jgi:ribulose 1,5-bisphosphate synthetase/thiazole synthase
MTKYHKHSFGSKLRATNSSHVPATRSVVVDIAILGAGYTGCWSAYYLLRDNPGLPVAVVEKEIVGFGACGRNGGWCSSKFPVTPGILE